MMGGMNMFFVILDCFRVLLVEGLIDIVLFKDDVSNNLLFVKIGLF